jgi:hypothetical protein
LSEDGMAVIEEARAKKTVQEIVENMAEVRGI